MAHNLPAGDLLREGLRLLGFPGADTVLDSGVAVRGVESVAALAERYLRELELFNAAFDLVGADNREDLVVRHVLDSLAPWKEFASLLGGMKAAGRPGAEDPYRVADAGSGAGFPGIPLAVAFPEISFTLIERMSKRCAFLENCSAMLRLTNVKVLNSEIERAPSGAYDAVAFRAFRPLDRAMIRTLLARLARPHGALAAWKARSEKIGEEMAGIEGEIGGYGVLPLTVPFLDAEERNLVVIRP